MFISWIKNYIIVFVLKDYFNNGFFIEFVDITYNIAILLGVFTIIYKNPVVSVLFLILLFIDIAGLLIFVGYDYIGLSYILVYVGAVSILFLFILMLINIRISELLSETKNDIPLAILTILLFYFIVIEVLPYSNLTEDISSNVDPKNNISYLYEKISYASSSGWDSTLTDITNITSIGNIMYTSYSIWLIITSNILLLAMIGAIVITISQKRKINNDI